MKLRRGEETLNIRHKVDVLSPSDAEDISEILKKSDPLWTETTAEKVVGSMKNGSLWLGVYSNGKVVSIGSTRLTDFGSMISHVATQLEYRNQGYATSIVSTLIERILEKSEYTLINVVSDNIPALKVYKKVGFMPHMKYILLEGRMK